MDILISVIGIVIAARVISWPVAAFSTLAGSGLFIVLILIGAGHLFTWVAAVTGLAAFFLTFYVLGARGPIPE